MPNPLSHTVEAAIRGCRERERLATARLELAKRSSFSGPAYIRALSAKLRRVRRFSTLIERGIAVGDVPRVVRNLERVLLDTQRERIFVSEAWEKQRKTWVHKVSAAIRIGREDPVIFLLAATGKLDADRFATLFEDLV